MNLKTIFPWLLAITLGAAVLLQNNQATIQNQRMMTQIKAIQSNQEDYALKAKKAARDADSDAQEIKDKLDEEAGE